MNSEFIHQIRTSVAELSAQISALSAKLDELSARLAAAEADILANELPSPQEPLAPADKETAAVEPPVIEPATEEPAAVEHEEHSAPVMEEHSAPMMEDPEAPVMEEPEAPVMDIIDLDALNFLDEDLPAPEPELESESAEGEETAHRTTLKDMYEAAQSCRWMHDLPGGPVSNIISAISLNDRVLLITQLFHEDPMLFNSAISAFNSMESLEQALEYINANFPEWNLDSPVVYRLIMALRRKLS